MSHFTIAHIIVEDVHYPSSKLVMIQKIAALKEPPTFASELGNANWIDTD